MIKSQLSRTHRPELEFGCLEEFKSLLYLKPGLIRCLGLEVKITLPQPDSEPTNYYMVSENIDRRYRKVLNWHVFFSGHAELSCRYEI